MSEKRAVFLMGADQPVGRALSARLADVPSISLRVDNLSSSLDASNSPDSASRRDSLLSCWKDSDVVVIPWTVSPSTLFQLVGRVVKWNRKSALSIVYICNTSTIAKTQLPEGRTVFTAAEDWGHRASSTSAVSCATVANLILDMSVNSSAVKSIVVCCGQVYGDECVQESGGKLVKSIAHCDDQHPVWSQDTDGSTSGRKTIPTLHVRDLAAVIGNLLSSSLPSGSVVMAVDGSSNPQALDSGPALSLNDEVFQGELKSLCCGFDVESNLSELALEPAGWFSRSGVGSFTGAMKCVSGYLSQMGLASPLVLCIAGPPLCGKSVIARGLSSRLFRLPVVSASSVVSCFSSLVDDADCETKLKTLFVDADFEALTSIVKRIKEERDTFNAASVQPGGSDDPAKQASTPAPVAAAAKGASLPKAEAVPVVEPAQSAGHVVYTPALFSEMVQMYVLHHRDISLLARTKGVILDGVVLDSSSAVKSLNVDVVVNVGLSATRREDRLARIPKEQAYGTHNDLPNFTRRNLAYKAKESLLQKAFAETEKIAFNADEVNDGNPDEHLTAVLKLLESSKAADRVRILMNLDTTGIQDESSNAKIKTDLDSAVASAIEAKSMAGCDQDQRQLHLSANELTDAKLHAAESLKASSDQANQAVMSIVDEKARPIRDYLLSSVMPHVQKGLQQMNKDRPSDPVAYFAQYLMTQGLSQNSSS